MTQEPAEILGILRFIATHDLCGDVFWTDELEFFVRCNDLFSWATADGESLAYQTLPILKQAIDDVNAVGDCDAGYALALYCCRQRQMRPQQPYYQEIPSQLLHLFDACGPDKETDNDPHTR